MVRYVDSAGWTWQVCEYADRAPDDRQPPLDSRLGDLAGSRELPAPSARRTTPADRPPGTDPERDRTLYFFSRRGTRKLRGSPATWSELPRQQLEALCERAMEIG